MLRHLSCSRALANVGVGPVASIPRANLLCATALPAAVGVPVRSYGHVCKSVVGHPSTRLALQGCTARIPWLRSPVAGPCASLSNPTPAAAPRWFSTASAPAAEAPPSSPSLFSRLFGKDSLRVPEGKRVNRWSMAVPAFMTHLCIGSPWAWSVLIEPLQHEHGFVTAAASDWAFSEVTLPLSIVFALQGIAAAIGAKWQLRVGHRTAMAVAGLCFGGGLALGAAGVATHQLWLLYAGYGVLGGCGVGLAYTPPVQSLIEWFPDRKGIASGLTIAGFGSGALIFAPAMSKLRAVFAEMPTYLGPASEVATQTKDGKLFAMVGDKLTEVVVATQDAVAQLAFDLPAGVYVVGTGDTGVTGALAVMSGVYTAIMLTSALTLKRPPQGYSVPVGQQSQAASASAPAGNVHVDQVMQTPQFAQLSTVFFCLAGAGIGLFSVAKPMMSEVFTSSLPLVVTSSFAGAYVMALSAGNLLGRLGWAAFSDKFGRRRTFQIFTLGSIPLYLAVPYLVDSVVTSGATLPLYVFMGSTVLAISCMGGTYALLPAYEADLYGNKYVGAIHGRLLLASSAAALAGPSVLLWLRGRAVNSALADLLAKVDPAKFENKFGVTVDNASELIAAKTVTIKKLLDLAPDGVVLADPSPFVYHSAVFTMAGFMVVAAVAHQSIRPVNPKYFEENIRAAAEATQPTQSTEAAKQP